MNRDPDSEHIERVRETSLVELSLLVALPLSLVSGMTGCANGELSSDEPDAGGVDRIGPSGSSARGPTASEEGSGPGGSSLPSPTDTGPSSLDTSATEEDATDSPDCSTPPCRHDTGPNPDVSSPDTTTHRDTSPRTDTSSPSDPCEKRDCGDHGTCQSTSLGTRCECESSYVVQSGTCVRERDPCRSINCSGHGICRIENGQATCNCRPGYRSQNLDCVPIDRDNDGVAANEDCDDRAPNRAPGMDETCDGTDNDCDGEVDENLRRDCPKQEGVCQGTEQICQQGSWTDCSRSYRAASNYQSDENACDGKDNDCDGQVDESCLNCYQLNMCIRPCAPGDDRCEQTIFERGAVSARQAYNQLARCANKRCSQTPEPAMCLRQTCSSAYDTCHAKTSGQSLSCSEFYRCRSRCSEGDQSCLDNCGKRISSSGRQHSKDFERCIQTHCSIPPTYGCIRQHCLREYISCFDCT